jgi:hypothetical protein
VQDVALRQECRPSWRRRRRSSPAPPRPRTRGRSTPRFWTVSGLETYVSGRAELIIDYAEARRGGEPISTATTEGTVQWLLHRRMGVGQQMRWSPRSAHRMLKVRTAVANGTLAEDHAGAERWARRPFRPAV